MTLCADFVKGPAVLYWLSSRRSFFIMWPYPRIIAHRGGGTLAPENTLAAMRCGLAHGFHAVEFDVMLTRDGVPVVLHDPVLGRTVAGSGSVADVTARVLTQRDAGVWFNAKFAGEKVPTYAQVAEFCLANRIWMNVEIKPVPGFEENTGRVVAQATQQLFGSLLALEQGDPARAGLPLFSSFSFEALQAARRSAPEIPRACLLDSVPDDWRAQLTALGAIAMDTNHLHLAPQQARAVKDAGFGLFCYTVNQPERVRELFGWGVDAVCTDRIDLIDAHFA
jgi:glycerophosphoryl diester phosphodiesterase